MVLSFRTDMLWQSVQTKIRLLLEDQVDRGLHCLPFHLHLLDKSLYGKTSLFEFSMITASTFGARKFQTFKVPTKLLDNIRREDSGGKSPSKDG